MGTDGEGKVGMDYIFGACEGCDLQGRNTTVLHSCPSLMIDRTRMIGCWIAIWTHGEASGPGDVAEAAPRIYWLGAVPIDC